MTEQPEAVVQTPKRRFAIRLPKRSTMKNAALVGGAFGLGAVVGARRVKNACACESDTTQNADQSEN